MNIAVRPMRRPLPRLEQASLELEIFLLAELGGRHADVLDVADAFALRKAGVVEGARIPENLMGDTC